MPKLVCFGSLRSKSSRGYNFNRFGGQTYIKDLMLKGYDMVSLGSYPAICPGKGTIKAELHDVEDEAFARIRRMELGAAYTEATIQVDGQDAHIYLMDAERLARYPKVPSGDWA